LDAQEGQNIVVAGQSKKIRTEGNRGSRERQKRSITLFPLLPPVQKTTSCMANTELRFIIDQAGQ
jgi:hypothetical protein